MGLEIVGEFVNQVLKADRETITLGIMLIRTVLVYMLGIIIVLWHKRFLGFSSSFDIIVRIMIGSLLANAIGGSYPFLATLGAVIGLVAVNWFLGMLAWHFPSLEKYIKGPTVVLFENNTFNIQAMHKHSITHEDLLKVLRERVHKNSLDDIQKILLENSGKISFIEHANS